jgi:hypothetical protein
MHTHMLSHTAMLNEKGDLVAAIADFRSIDSFNFSDLRTSNSWKGFRDVLRSSKTIVLDGNFSVEALSEIGNTLFFVDGQNKQIDEFQLKGGELKESKKIVWWEPTSVAKATRYLRSKISDYGVTHVSPNLQELLAMDHAICGEVDYTEDFASESSCSSVSSLMTPYLEKELRTALNNKDFRKVCELIEAPVSRVAYGGRRLKRTNIVLKLGEYGAIVVEHDTEDTLVAHWLPAASIHKEVNGPLWYEYITNFMPNSLSSLPVFLSFFAL